MLRSDGGYVELCETSALLRDTFSFKLRFASPGQSMWHGEWSWVLPSGKSANTIGLEFRAELSQALRLCPHSFAY